MQACGHWGGDPCLRISWTAHFLAAGHETTCRLCLYACTSYRYIELSCLLSKWNQVSPSESKWVQVNSSEIMWVHWQYNIFVSSLHIGLISPYLHLHLYLYLGHGPQLVSVTVSWPQATATTTGLLELGDNKVPNQMQGGHRTPQRQAWPMCLQCRPLSHPESHVRRLPCLVLERRTWCAWPPQRAWVLDR